MNKGIYLCAFTALHEGYDLTYQDRFEKRDVGGDCMDVDLTPYDYYICTPPCNWWSHANRRRNESEYALSTRHLLPCMLLKLLNTGKPFIVENVRNRLRFTEAGLFILPCFVYEIGRHTYWTNIMLPYLVKQNDEYVCHVTGRKRQGGKSVHEVVEIFLSVVADRKEKEVKQNEMQS